MDREKENHEECNMKIGPRYKIARRLGSQVFEKTQTQKFMLRESQKLTKSRNQRPRSRSNYGIQLLEKQKVRFTYGLTEKQFTIYLKKVIQNKGENLEQMLYEILERRLDNIILRSGFAQTRQAARQIVSHGHILVNGKRVAIPSYSVVDKDQISIREKSLNKGNFIGLNERIKDTSIPAWLSVDMNKKTIKIKGNPNYISHESHFNLGAVIQFYKR